MEVGCSWSHDPRKETTHKLVKKRMEEREKKKKKKKKEKKKKRKKKAQDHKAPLWHQFLHLAWHSWSSWQSISLHHHGSCSVWWPACWRKKQQQQTKYMPASHKYKQKRASPLYLMLMHWWIRQKVSKIERRAFSINSARQATRKKSLSRTCKHITHTHTHPWTHTQKCLVKFQLSEKF